MPDNKLYFGDNLDILYRYISDDSVDLIHLDPPFKSSQHYNILFAEQNGPRSAAQIKAFEDTWRWDEAARPHSLRAGGPKALCAQRRNLPSPFPARPLEGTQPRIVEYPP